MTNDVNNTDNQTAEAVAEAWEKHFQDSDNSSLEEFTQMVQELGTTDITIGQAAEWRRNRTIPQ